MAESLGKAVLELETDGGKFSSGLRAAKRDSTSFVRDVGGGLASIGKFAALAGVGIAAIGTVAATKAGFGFNQMRQQAEIAFTTMLGSGQKAKAFLDDLQQFAAKTPFEFSGLVESSQKLLAMGFAAEDVIPTMTAIGDAVAALGGNAGTLDRVTVALGQIQAKGKASAEEMLQLTEAGIPAWQFLADKIGKSVPEAMKLVSKGAIDAKTTVDAVTQGMEKRFGGMMDKQSHTFAGLWSTVKDTFSQISGSVMKPFFDLATRGLQAVVDHLPGIQRAVEAFMRAPMHRKLEIVWEGIKDAGKALMSAMQKAIGLVNWATVWSKAGGIAEGLAKRFKTINWTTVGKAIGDGIADALARTLSAGKKLAGALNNMVNNVDWVTLGRAMGPGLAAAIASAFVTLTDPMFWARNWDLALAVMLTVFGGGLGKIAGKLGAPFARLGGAMVLRLAGEIERFSPRLAEALVAGLLRMGDVLGTVGGRLAAILGKGLSALETVVRTVFGRLGGLAVFAIKVIGIDIAIRALVQFATGPVWNQIRAAFTSIQTFATNTWNAITAGIRTAGTTIVSATTTAWNAVRNAIATVMTAIQSAVRAVWDWLTRTTSAAFSTVVATIRGSVGRAASEAHAVGVGILKGVSDGLTGLVKMVQGWFQTLWGFIKGAANSAYAFALNIGKAIIHGIEQGFLGLVKSLGDKLVGAVTGVLKKLDPRNLNPFSPVSHWAFLLGQQLVAKVDDVQRILGPALTRTLTKALQDSTSAAAPAAVKGMGVVGNAIVAAAKKYGIDARAAMAVAMTEGGLKFGAVGDNGTSFGPFQLHLGGELGGMDPAKAKAFANSIEGINFALRRMAEEGAKGLTGLAAIKQIVGGPGWGFERPLHAAAEVAKAWGYFKELGPQASAAIAKAAPMVTGQIRQLAALVKQYAPQIGLEHARGIIAGLVQGTPGIVAQARQQMQQAVAAQKQAVIDARQGFVSAFNDLANSALAAFDARVAAWKPPSQKMLDKMQAEDQSKAATDQWAAAVADVEGGGKAMAVDLSKTLGDALGTALQSAFSSIAGAKTEAALNKVSATAQQQVMAAIDQASAAAVADAQAQVDAAKQELAAAQATGDPEAIAAAKQKLDEAVGRQKALDDAIRQEKEQATAQLVLAEQTRHDQIVAKEREGLAKQLAELKAWLLKHPEEWSKMGGKVQAILTEYNVKLVAAGTAWAHKFGDGVQAGIPYAVAKARALASAVAAELPSTNSPLQPAKRGPLAFHPFNMGKLWGENLGAGLASAKIGNLFGSYAGLGSLQMRSPSFAVASGGSASQSQGGDLILQVNGAELGRVALSELLRAKGRNVSLGLS